MTQPGKTLSVVVILMTYLPIVAGLILAGYLLGWKVPIAFLGVMGFVLYRARRGKSRRVPGRLRTIVEVLVFGLGRFNHRRTCLRCVGRLPRLRRRPHDAA
jgi:hypothetical protein